MPILNDWSLTLTAEQVLRAQGVDPRSAQGGTPRMRQPTVQAMELGLPLLEPVVAYRQLKVKSIQHERLVLADEHGLSALAGKAIARLLAPARQVIVLACTIGAGVERFASALLPTDFPLGMALDALGSAAVERLVEAACATLGEAAAGRDWQASIPFSPGMPDWPAGPGQQGLLAVLDGAEPLSAQAGIALSSSGMLIPQKSITAVIGLGPEMDGSGQVCDYCSARQTCRYKDTYSSGFENHDS